MTSPTRKLKPSELTKTRLTLLESQGFMCAICGNACSVQEAVLDHNHGFSADGTEAGYVRAVLHRTCNAVEGKVVNSMRRFGIKDPMKFMAGLVKYHELHSTNQTGLIHPLHFTPEEKIQRKKDKVIKAREKVKADKLKVLKDAEKAKKKALKELSKALA
jgi:hypothetical protein